jgi:3-oxoacyl-[acyl-carrier-protein] synthase II
MAVTYRDYAGRPVVVVTGLGLITSLGAGVEDNWRRLTAGESGIHAITRFPTDGMKTRIGGTIDFVPRDELNAQALSQRIAELAAEEAVAQAAIGGRGDFPGALFVVAPPAELEWPQRRALAVAAGTSDSITSRDLLRGAGNGFAETSARFQFDSIADGLSQRFGTKGSPITVTTACASGATVIQLGVEAIRRAETDAALCIATDAAMHPEMLIRYSLLSALSTANDPPQSASKPFSKNRDGFVMAEGAAALVLESLDHAKARGARILGVIEGCGERVDPFHRTRMSPDASPIVGCIEKALADAGVTPDEIDYINPHGSSTPENDKMESLAIMTAFGERAKAIPLSSNKSMVGHTMSAAGAIESVFTLLTLDRGRLPPTINYEIPDPAIPLDVVPNRARDARVRHALSNSFGFGGQTFSLVMAREPI